MPALTATLAAAAALGLYAGWVEPRRLVMRRFSVRVPGLSAPVRAVAIGDLQPWRPHWPASRLRAAFARAQAERPDVVFWLGDYFNAPTKWIARRLAGRPRLQRAWAAAQTPMDEIAAEMGRLTAPMGAFAVLGNHDWGWDGEACAAMLRDVGVRVLIGETAEAVHPATGARLWIGGLDDVSSGRGSQADRVLPLPAPAVLLTHAPDVWPALAAPALTLAGHSHGGQVAPGFRLKLPQHARNHPRGWYARGPARLYVTGGIGCSGVPFRLGVAPEIVVLDLKPG